MLPKDLTRLAVTGYLAVLGGLSRDETVTAFALAAEECEFFPAPARLLALSGRTARIEAEAQGELTDLAYTLTKWPMLKPHRGELLNEGRDGEGGPYLPAEKRQYGPASEPPPLSETAAAALTALGDGNLAAGLLRITPAISGILGMLSDEQGFERRQAAGVVRMFEECYRRVRA